MPRPVVTVEGLAKQFAGKPLFENVSFHVEAGERVALCGPNGSGKSTLLKILGGSVQSDAGQVRFAPNAGVAYLTQHADAAKDATVRDVLTAGGGVPAELAAEAAELEQKMADPAIYENGESDAIVARYGELQREIALAKADSAPEPEENPFLASFGFGADVLDRKFASLSGGERNKVLLSRTLVDADAGGLLVLDEPTNHLDIETMEWLEEWLLDFAGAVIVVAHDRAFLDNVTTRVLAFERGKLASYPGNYSEFERRREEDAERLAALKERQEKELKRQHEVIQQFRHQKRLDGQMGSRMKRLSKYREAVDRTPDPLLQELQFRLKVDEAQKSSNDMLHVRGLAKQFGDRILFYGLDLDVDKGDRLGIVGPNGSGKSTLLKILTGKEPKNLGNIEVAPGVKGAYFAQGEEKLNPKFTLEAEVRNARPGIEAEDARALLGRFGFRHEDDPQRTVATLSGGERARLALLKTVITPANLLVLDEPTNHLDIESRRELARALNAFEGTLLVVSHDRWFMDSVVDKVAVVARRTVKVFNGDLTEARTSELMQNFSVEKPTRYRVRKGFKDYDTGVKHAADSVLELTPADFEEKRLFRTALSLGWIEEE